MTRKETETALKLCSEGMDPTCNRCPYASAGCFRKVMRDALRYIEQLKMEAKHDEPKRKEVRGKR